MAGHSKWANIQHRKGKQDKKRAVLFARLSKEITVASKMGGPDPNMNPRLRLAITNAKGVSVPKDNIQRAIDKGQSSGGADYADIRYEGVGPGGVGIIIEASTDNKNRAATDIRTAFSKNGGALGTTGSVSFNFDQLGEIEYPASAGTADEVMEAAIMAGAQDVESSEEGHWIYTAREDFAAVSTALAETFGSKIEPVAAKIIWKPKVTTPVSGEAADQLMKMLDVLDELDDVQSVYDNSELSEDEMARLSGG
ncbi:MAG: YebC/PmpR family DNA-binding transcriptional regulator [Alphaproteobacteria bacterium HGW-Alphaproteobacteria-18]|nr:MAG: YebC/PmpR family DNA-binding transcriptional regulator [Alphaproteobacteria bacterium HGW-Alphaproteobacteria-18]